MRPAGAAIDRVRDDPVVGWARRGLDRLADTDDGVVHLWLHPHNAVDRHGRERMREVLAHVARLRDRGEIEVETMGEVAARTAAGSGAAVGDRRPADGQRPTTDGTTDDRRTGTGGR